MIHTCSVFPLLVTSLVMELGSCPESCGESVGQTGTDPTFVEEVHIVRLFGPLIFNG
jgi:hypothetical protein